MKKIILPVISITVVALLYLTFDSGGQTSGLAAGATAIGSQEASIEQTGPAWYNSDWHYRQAVTISNSGGQLDNYQVLVRLDNSNFDFSKARAKGEDLLFTANDGTTLIDSWIESWNSGLAYVWVEVPAIISGNSSIYLYYNNPVGSITKSGTATFDFFDGDWCQFPGSECTIPDKWNVLDGFPTVSAGNLVLINNTGVSTIGEFLYQAVGYSANFGLGSGGYEWGGFINGASQHRTMIGDRIEDKDNMYLLDYVNNYDYDNLLGRQGGNDWHNSFHIYEVRWRSGQSMGDIDHGVSTATDSNQVPNDDLPVTFYSFFGSNATILVDWVYVRKYTYPEPAVNVGTEQGLVDLRITMVDAPDPVYAGEGLTYTIAITNTSGIDALGVTLTDTLPGGVDLVNVSPSQGTCNSEVVCDLGDISAGSQVHISLVVEPTMDGNLPNSAVVGSQSYDQDFGDNTSPATTTVLPSADLAIDLQGYPEAVLPDGILTYIINVTNQGPSIANAVGVTETLPAGVSYLNSSPIVCSADSGKVTCPLTSPLGPGMNAQILITSKVPSGATRNLTSSAIVGSNTHEPNPTNNNDVEENLLDATKPSVVWVLPVNNVDDTYRTQGGIITLEASASDNDQIARVEFNYWDHMFDNDGDGELEGQYVAIGTATTSPYQVDFDSSVFVPGETYQVFIKAYDRAGNPSDRLRIFIERLPNYFYMPLIRR